MGDGVQTVPHGASVRLPGGTRWLEGVGGDSCLAACLCMEKMGGVWVWL